MKNTLDKTGKSPLSHEFFGFWITSKKKVLLVLYRYDIAYDIAL